MQSPKVPAVHMNTRYIVTTRSWFGGGADLTPMVPHEPDTHDFHAALRADLRRARSGLPSSTSRNGATSISSCRIAAKPRGVGGIFYDYLDSGDHARDFAFTRAVGETFLDIYPKLVRRHMNEPWTDAERAHQLARRGRYVEFNLLHDRGTRGSA